MTIPLANTRAKLPRSITIKVGPDLGAVEFTSAAAANLSSLLSQSTQVGAVDKITIDQKVDLVEWREFDADGQGQVVEWVPTKEEISFTMEGVILYSGDIIDRVYGGVNTDALIDSLLAMKSAFVIEITERRYALNQSTNEENRTTLLLGCRLSNRPLTVNIGTAELIRQECTGKAARIMRTAWAPAA